MFPQASLILPCCLFGGHYWRALIEETVEISGVCESLCVCESVCMVGEGELEGCE